jgi:hypothetical protein
MQGFRSHKASAPPLLNFNPADAEKKRVYGVFPCLASGSLCQAEGSLALMLLGELSFTINTCGN